MTKEKKQAKAPAMAVYHVREGKGDKSYWTRVGAAWAHDDGQGFNVSLDCVPVDGKLVLRAPKPEDEQD